MNRRTRAQTPPLYRHQVAAPLQADCVVTGNHRLRVSGRREPVPEPSWVLHDAPSCGMSLIGCEEGTDEAGPKELRDTCNTWSQDGLVGSVS